MDGQRGLGRDELAHRWALVWPHRERLLRLARRRVRDGSAAEDCVHEALLRCVQFGDLDEDRVGALLTTVTIRVCVDEQRRRAHADRLRLRLAGYADTAPPVEEAVCDRAEAVWLASHVARLPDQQRRALAGRAAGKPHRQVAADLNTSAKAVESLLGRARATLRHTWDRGLAALFPPLLAATRDRDHPAPAGLLVGALAMTAAVVAPAAPPADPDRRPPPAAAGPAATAGVPLRVTPVARSGPADPEPGAAAPPRPVVRPRTGTPSPDATPEPGPPTDVHVDIYDSGETDDYTTEERIWHCVRYGARVEIGRVTGVQCNYPHHGEPGGYR